VPLLFDEEDPWTRIGGRVAAARTCWLAATIGGLFCKEEGSLTLSLAEGAQKSQRGSQQSSGGNAFTYTSRYFFLVGGNVIDKFLKSRILVHRLLTRSIVA